jgi:ATP-binding cassette subfamily B protein
MVFGIGVWSMAAHRITLGGLLAFSALLAYTYPPVQRLGQFMLLLTRAKASTARVAEIMDARPRVGDEAARQISGTCRGWVEFQGVGFHYPGARRPALEPVSFTAGPGQLVAIVGASGTGKSTMTKLLLRFYDPTAGQILLDGIDLRQIRLATLRDNVTLLQQESLMFPGTIRENIAYGRPDATTAEIVEAACAAEAHDFITALPDRYDTVMGQRGRLLSGGQRQRISIARAILRDSPVLILDEPTTGLDRPTAERVLRPLRRLMAGRTTILITHDLDLVPQPDLVVSLGGWALPDMDRTRLLTA